MSANDIEAYNEGFLFSTMAKADIYGDGRVRFDLFCTFIRNENDALLT